MEGSIQIADVFAIVAVLVFAVVPFIPSRRGRVITSVIGMLLIFGLVLWAAARWTVWLGLISQFWWVVIIIAIVGIILAFAIKD